ncbi:unnamed protein product [Phytophthora fragariaefolia]|uniref:Unnamed protein product n=1 Tax=Phytophthora fragariaefolia TaxID=1490495 RepID=A0A9W6X5Q7_9STRA|nr:unnamed protein product [Phytophthora fragariaefolia]
MSKPSQNVTDKLAFHGKKSLFAEWKDKVKAHLIARSDALVVTELQAGRKEPVACYEHALLGEISVPEPGANASDDEKSAFALQQAFVRQQASYIKDLLDLTLPAGFADERLMQRPVHEIRRAVERRYGLNTASGVVELVPIFEKISNSDFKSVAHLFQQLKAARDQANRNSCEALKTGLISQHLMLIRCWRRGEISDLAKGVRVAHVDAAPAKPGVTGKPNGTAKPNSSVLGKRKAPPVPEQDSHYNLGAMSCQYCAGVHNKMYGFGSHLKFQCPKRAKDHAQKVYWRDIWSTPKGIPKQLSSEPTPKMKGKGKKKAKAVRKEIPTEDCLPKTVPCKAVQTTQPPSPTVELEQPASPTVSVTPPPGTFEPMDTDEPMEQFDLPVNAGSVIMSQPLGPEAIAETARGIESMTMMLEDTVRSLYPFLLNLDDALTSDSWVLDSGCGFGLTSDASKLVEHRPDNGYMLTFAEGSKHMNTHVALEFWFKKSGYHIIELQSGDFKFYEGNLAFVAKAVNGAYYVQNKIIKERQILCNSAKAQPCVPLENNGGERLEKTLQEWHVELGHLNNDMIIGMLSKRLVTGMSTLPASGLRKVPFFCTTCAEMKKRRMSYRNKKGSRDTQPISTIHMDTNVPMKTMGVYGSIGTIKYFLSIIDDNTSWRWTYVLRNKQEVYENVESLLLRLEREGEFTIRRNRSDGGTEFVNTAFKTFCKKKGIAFQTSNAYSPEENGAAGRDHQSKLDRVRCALKDADMAHRWWPEATISGRRHLCTESTVAVGAEVPALETTGAVGATSKRRRGLIEAIPNREPRPRRVIKKPKRYSDYQCFQAKMDESIAKDILENRVPTPRSLKEALRGPHREQWKQALELEYDSLIENGSWRLVPLPPGRKALPCHWVLVVKYNADRSVERFKARQVAQGNHQDVGHWHHFGLSYPSKGCTHCIPQLDYGGRIKGYMRQPHGFVKRGHENLVCELLKSIYGLKQAPRIWYRVLHTVLLSMGFTRCHKEFCIYVQKAGVEWLIVVVYVDDLTIMSRNTSLINRLKVELSKRFKLKDLGDIHYILKMEVRRNRDQRVMMISQRKYIAELITKYKLGESTPVMTPQVPGLVLEPETKLSAEQIAAQPFDYRGIVGSLQYLVRGTRPDIANAVRE